jgi:hypothetical protein
VPPPTRVERTEAIFEQPKTVNPEADRAAGTLRISIDAKATVYIGPDARRAKRRTRTRAADHDFKPEPRLTPSASSCRSPTNSGRFDVLEGQQRPHLRPVEQSCREVGMRSLRIETLSINPDCGPEDHSRRAQFLDRIVE